MDEAFIEQLYQRIAKDRDLFPNVPETAVKILNAMEDPNCNNQSLARIIQVDAGLSAFIIKSASSLRFFTRIAPKDLTSAIRRMGIRETYYLSVSFLSRSAFHSENRAVKKLLSQSYSLSTKTAVIAYFLAGKLKRFEPGQAMLAGLMHDIGVPAVLVALSEHEAVFNDPDQRDQVINLLAARVGLLILKDWGFDPCILDVLRCRDQWLRDHEQLADLADLILVSRFHALIGSSQFRSCPPIDEMPAFHKLELGGLGPDNALAILKESQQELQAIGQLLAA